MSQIKVRVFNNYAWFARILFSVALALSVGFELFGRSVNWQITIALLSVAVSSVFLIQKQKLDEARLFKELFQEFNRRYNHMNGHLYKIKFKESLLSEEDKLFLIDYFNLCSEEYLFNKEDTFIQRCRKHGGTECVRIWKMRTSKSYGTKRKRERN